MRRLLRLLPLLLLPSCMVRYDFQGPLQPQAIDGPCQVDRFFLVRFQSTPTNMVIRNTGQACSFALVNAALNIPLNAVLLTRAPRHGQAAADLISTGRQAAASYTPLPGYVGPDEFSITIEPNAVGVTVHVTVQGR